MSLTETVDSSSGSARRHKLNLLGLVALSLAIFILDLLAPLEWSVCIAYIVVVVLAHRSQSPMHVWIAAVVGTVLTVAKLFFETRLPDMWPVFTNRALSISAIWTVAVLGAWRRGTAADDALRRGQRRLEAVSQLARIGSWELDLATREVTWSAEVYRIHEVEIGHPPPLENALSFFPEPSREILLKALKDASENGVSFDHMLGFVTARGTPRWVRSLCIPEQRDGVTVCLTGAFQDVTEQEETRARLARSIRGTQDGIWEQNVATRATWLSPQFRSSLGYDEASLPDGADAFGMLLHEEDVDTLESAREAHLTRQEPMDLHVRLRRSDGEFRSFRVRAAAETDNLRGTVLLSGSVRDITRVLQAERDLIAAKEAAAEASASKGNFLANMSHEIRTPMNGVLGMTEMLLETTLDTTQRQFANTIRSSASALLTILNDILDFSKIEAGKLDLEHIAFNLRDCVKDVAAMMALQASRKGLELTVKVEPGTAEFVVGDPHRLRQILVNLCGNAIKFTAQGEVAIEVRHLATRGGKPLLSFEVHDTGMGMSADTVTRLFQPFSQADASTTRNFGGTGLGLSIVRHLIELMGGEIHVVSVEGRGSTFAFTLPFRAAEASETAAVAQSGRFGMLPDGTMAPRFQGSVLLVEDNPVNRQIAVHFLRRLGCTVTVAEDGKSALDQCAQHTFDLVLMDVQMPVMDGLTATRELRRLEGSGSRVPIVALTASAMSGDRDRCLAAGMDALLPKPLEQPALRSILERFGLAATGKV